MRFFNPVDKANELVSIEKALDLAGVTVAEHVEGKYGKLKCPFGDIYHSDGGLEATLRIYTETNTARCFRCNHSFSPVWLMSQVWGVRSKDAAWKLLEIVGFKLPTFDELWAIYTNPPEEIPDSSMLALALKTYCARICTTWASEQFNPTTSLTLARCLELLEQVDSAARAEEWLVAAKRAMTRIIGEYDG